MKKKKDIKTLEFTDVYCGPFHSDGCYIYSGANGEDDYSITALDFADWEDHYHELYEITDILNGKSDKQFEVIKVENEYIHLKDVGILEVRAWGYLTSTYIRVKESIFDIEYFKECENKLKNIQDTFALWVASKLDKDFKP